MFCLKLGAILNKHQISQQRIYQELYKTMRMGRLYLVLNDLGTEEETRLVLGCINELVQTNYTLMDLERMQRLIISKQETQPLFMAMKYPWLRNQENSFSVSSISS